MRHTVYFLLETKNFIDLSIKISNKKEKKKKEVATCKDVLIDNSVSNWIYVAKKCMEEMGVDSNQFVFKRIVESYNGNFDLYRKPANTGVYDKVHIFVLPKVDQIKIGES